MYARVYVEITNICNLQCSFCPSTQRKARFMTPAQFETVTEQLRGYSRYLYFHLMGEPLLHPELERLLEIAAAKGFYVNFTTNGTLLSERGAIIANSPTVHRINISLQSFEGNQTDADIFNYVNHCARFAKAAAAAGKIVSLRLWNGGGAEKRNGDILQALQRVFPAPWQIAQKNTVLDARVFLEFGEKFDEQFGKNAEVSPKSIVDVKKFEVVTPDVSIKVNPERTDLVSTQVINGVRYIMIRANEGVEVNGVNISIK